MQSNPAKTSLNRKWIMITALILALIILSSCLLTANYNTNTSAKREFYVGVEVAYGGFGDLKALVTEVKNYTNLIVLGLPEFSINRTLLDQSCDYIYNSGLSFIVLFTNISQYSGWHDITPA